MSEQRFVRELSEVLSVLSPAQRDQLHYMLQDPVRRRAFQQLIQSTLKLSNQMPSHLGTERGVRGDVISSAERFDEDSVKESFASILWDKKTFRTTRDVLSAVRYFFEIDLNPYRFTKAGRRDAIAEAWRQLTQLPAKERKEKLRRFFQEFAGLLDPHRSYRELFRILSRSD